MKVASVLMVFMGEFNENGPLGVIFFFGKNICLCGTSDMTLTIIYDVCNLDLLL